jgi:hypothetical protein
MVLLGIMLKTTFCGYLKKKKQKKKTGYIAIQSHILHSFYLSKFGKSEKTLFILKRIHDK